MNNVLGKIMSDQGDELPVSAMPVDGTFPTATTQWEKRNVSLTVPAWDAKTAACCYGTTDLEALETLIPGIASSARSYSDVNEPGQEHPHKAGPCVCFDGMETFTELRHKLDGCLTGSRLAKDRAADALAQVMIPEALDYPM